MKLASSDVTGQTHNVYNVKDFNKFIKKVRKYFKFWGQRLTARERQSILAVFTTGRDHFNIRNQLHVGKWNIQNLFLRGKLHIAGKEICKNNLLVRVMAETHW